jgi:hypothetical protein
VREGVLYLVRVYLLKDVDLDSQESVANSQVSYEKLVRVNNQPVTKSQSVGCQHSEDRKHQRTAPRRDIRRSEPIVTRRIVMTT